MRPALLCEYADRQCELHPDSRAIVGESSALTHQQLSDASNRIAHLLLEIGCIKGDRVALCMPKSPTAIVCLLGIIKAGCIFVPLDYASPFQRIRLVIDSASIKCILVADISDELLNPILRLASESSFLVGWLSETARNDIPFAFTAADLAAVSGAQLTYSPQSTDPVQLLFTSGSTGLPKGVIITHDNVRHFVDWAIAYFDCQPGDRVSGHPPLHFDLSTLDIFGALASGAELHLVPQLISLLPHRTAAFIREHELNQWFSVPSVLNFMAKFDTVRQKDFPSLKRVLWCGEKLPVPSLVYWMSRLPHVSFTNLYGPTETTIASSYYRVPKLPDSELDIPIGVPCPGEDLLVLDEQMRKVRAGELGELYIRGVGLSPGYWQDPQKTASAFVQNPFSPERDLIYKTGDLASVDSQGLVYLHGRCDSQIKSRGYRIELGEIETALHTHHLIRECAVVALSTNEFEGTSICCSLVPVDGAALKLNEVRNYLSQRLPSYMLPVRWFVASSLPLNGNGKIDRKKIREQVAAELRSSSPALPA